MASNPSSLDRIVSYFQALAVESFTYKGRMVEPYRELRISPAVFRSYTCPSGCGACCMKVTLDWPEQTELVSRPIEFAVNGVSVTWRTEDQVGNDTRYCRYLQSDGRCGIYHQRPLPCRLELFKFYRRATLDRIDALVHLPGRGSMLQRVSGGTGNKCQITPYDPELTKTHIRDLLILGEWMDMFGIKHCVPTVVKWLETGPHAEPLSIARSAYKGLLDEN